MGGREEEEVEERIISNRRFLTGEQKQGDVAGSKAMKNAREGLIGRYWLEISLRCPVKAAWE